jgi:hypothetical protein
MPLKSFNFNMIQPYAIMQFLFVHSIILCFSKIDYGIVKGGGQNTFQSSMPLLNPFFG